MNLIILHPLLRRSLTSTHQLSNQDALSDDEVKTTAVRLNAAPADTSAENLQNLIEDEPHSMSALLSLQRICLQFGKTASWKVVLRRRINVTPNSSTSRSSRKMY